MNMPVPLCNEGHRAAPPLAFSQRTHPLAVDRCTPPCRLSQTQSDDGGYSGPERACTRQRWTFNLSTVVSVDDGPHGMFRHLPSPLCALCPPCALWQPHPPLKLVSHAPPPRNKAAPQVLRQFVGVDNLGTVRSRSHEPIEKGGSVTRYDEKAAACLLRDARGRRERAEKA